MIRLLRERKVIFFDVGYTLDAPASGDWMMTGKFLDAAGARLRQRGEEEIRRAMGEGIAFLMKDHLVTTVEDEISQFTDFYSILSDRLGLGLSREEARRVAEDRARNMNNYVPYPGAADVLRELSKTHALGVISDTWPSVEKQLEYLGVSRYLSFRTFSCFLGVFKPDRRMFADALEKCGVPARETVFIDDSVRNLEGAAGMGITPILIAAEPAADVETAFTKIRDLRELIEREE